MTARRPPLNRTWIGPNNRDIQALGTLPQLPRHTHSTGDERLERAGSRDANVSRALGTFSGLFFITYFLYAVVVVPIRQNYDVPSAAMPYTQYSPPPVYLFILIYFFG